MKLEVEFVRNATVRQTCRAVIEMDDAESVDRKILDFAIKNLGTSVKSFVVETQQYDDVRDTIEKVERMKA